MSEKAKTINATTKSYGIRKAELLNLQYDTPLLKGIFFVSTFLVSYCFAFDNIVRGNLQLYATSSYSQHSLFTTVKIIQSVISAASQPAFARLSDRFGRLELTFISIVLYFVGTVIQSQAYDIKRYAAGASIHQAGASGMMIMLQIMLADFSNLNWRLVATFVPELPFVINAWVSGDTMDFILDKYSWQWGIGMWCIIFPVSCIPLLACFIHMNYKVRNTPEWNSLIEEENNKKTLNKEENTKITYSKLTLKYWKALVVDLWKYWKTLAIELFWDLDIVGLLFVIVILGLILVPFTIAGGIKSKWAKSSTLVPLFLGFSSIPLFIIWESKIARIPIMPIPLMKDRGVWSALFIAIMINWVWYMPNDFMYTVLVVGMRASIKAATRITALYSFVACISGPMLGLVVVKVRRLKMFIILGVFCWCISLGIFIYFRGANDGIQSQKYLNGVIGGLILMGFGAGFYGNSTLVSIVTVTNHEYMGIIISLYMASYYVGAAVGVSVSGAIWTNKMYPVILNNMNDMGVYNSTGLAKVAYEDPFEFIKTNVWGTPARIAVVVSYAKIQRYLCIVGLALCFPLLLLTLFLRNHRLETVQSLERKDDGKMVVVNDNDDDLIADKLKGFLYLASH